MHVMQPVFMEKIYFENQVFVKSYQIFGILGLKQFRSLYLWRKITSKNQIRQNFRILRHSGTRTIPKHQTKSTLLVRQASVCDRKSIENLIEEIKFVVLEKFEFKMGKNQ